MATPNRPRHERRWLAPLEAEDQRVGLLAAGIAQVVFFFTAAPSITFLDSGELVMAATGFGVPHPTGYPLWSVLAWLFTLLPLGHSAWEVNLFSGVCAALATGLLAGLLSHGSRRGGVSRRPAQVIALCLSLCFAFTTSVWSQAVIAEVYTLHVLLVAILLLVLYRWLLDPEWRYGFLVAVFVLSVGLTNHHLVLALAPLPLLVAFLIQRRTALELSAYCAGAGAVVYIAFGSLSAEASMQETAMRSAQLAVALFVSVVLLRHRLQAWKTGLAILPVVALGLLPYAYLPVASSTNPPMNWGYTQTADGFFYSVNRTPYQSPLSSQLQDTVGRVVGTGEAQTLPGKRTWDGRKTFGLYLRNYRDSLHASFTPLVWLFLGVALWRLWPERRRAGPWIVVLGAGVFLSAILQAATSAEVDAGGLAWLDWRLQMPYLGYSFLFVTLLVGIGVAATWQWLVDRSRSAGAVGLVVVAGLPVLAFGHNLDSCSQRGHDFARRYGVDMLSQLPPGSVLFGGSDAGRFVSTWMILGESFEPARHRYEPDFDRRDLYLITQPQLPARFYHYYIRDHYGDDRPQPGGFGRWLGRDEQYPEKPLVLPDDDQLREIVRQVGAEIDLRAITEATAAWIFHANKAEHSFFIEESRIMSWALPHVIPQGPVYQLAPEPVADLDPATIEIDRSYWRRTVAELLSDDDFLGDSEARLPFGSLRRLGGDVYRSRQLFDEAELAYRQALELVPADLATSASLADLLYSRGRFEEAAGTLEGLPEHPVVDEVAERYRQALRSRQSRASQHAQLLIRPVSSPVLKTLLETYQEATGSVVVDLVEDLRGGKAGYGNPVTLRRLLANYRTLEEESVAAVVGQMALDEGGAHRRAVLRLLFAFQKIRAGWGDESEELRRELGRRLADIGEIEAAREVVDLGRVWGQDRSELHGLFDQLAEERVALDPLLERIRSGDRLNDVPQELLSALGRTDAMSEIGQPELARAVARLSRALVAYRPDRPDARALTELVESYRQLLLPEPARGVLQKLTQTPDLPPDVLDTAVRLAADDLRPDLLTDLVNAQARQGLNAPASLIARASFQFALNDQQGLIQTLAILNQAFGREQLFALIATDPQLGLLAGDYKFREFMIRSMSSGDGT
ncbi:MAG: DUF2723 domain-containing protein [Thermoanaerobaculia bacterium]|nr:DUF2723 domain-containing protein [Thermoanaerobaculia bacterium]